MTCHPITAEDARQIGSDSSQLFVITGLIATLNLAVAAIYLVHLDRGIGLGGYRIDLEVYRVGAAAVLHGGDLYGELPRLGDGYQLPSTYPPFAALSFIPLAILSYSTASWLLTGGTIAGTAASLWRYVTSTAGEAGALMRRRGAG
jgi:alpha-1,2-mannosyltransferase